jgi:hypothetical protein
MGPVAERGGADCARSWEITACGRGAAAALEAAFDASVVGLGGVHARTSRRCGRCYALAGPIRSRHAPRLVRDGHNQGYDFPDLAAARHAATKRMQWQEWRMEVTDQAGETLITLRFVAIEHETS